MLELTGNSVDMPSKVINNMGMYSQGLKRSRGHATHYLPYVLNISEAGYTINSSTVEPR